MGLWLKQDDGSLVEVSGGGGGGSFDGEHVLTGDPSDPAVVESVAEGQLLYDGVESDGSGGGPHDHDYLPLTGGTLTGTLAVDKNLTLASETSNPLMLVNRAGTRVGYFGVPGAQAAENGELHLRSDKELMLQGIDGVRTLQCDLQVDGDLRVDGSAAINTPDDFWAKNIGVVFCDFGMIGGTQGSYATSMTANGYRNTGGKWTSLGAGGSTGAAQISLLPGGTFEVRVASNHPTGSANNPPIRFTVTEAGPTFRAQPSTTRSTDEILERAETAEFPPEDDEGVATMDGHDEVPLFEVVTALLAKVKELSAEIEELRGA